MKCFEITISESFTWRSSGRTMTKWNYSAWCIPDTCALLLLTYSAVMSLIREPIDNDLLSRDEVWTIYLPAWNVYLLVFYINRHLIANCGISIFFIIDKCFQILITLLDFLSYLIVKYFINSHNPHWMCHFYWNIL